MVLIAAIECDEKDNDGIALTHIKGVDANDTRTLCGHSWIHENTYDEVDVTPSKITCTACKDVAREIMQHFGSYANLKKVAKT